MLGRGLFLERWTCYLKNVSVTAEQRSSDTGVHMALAANINKKTDNACPWANGTDHTTPNGLEFEVVCASDMTFDDYCPSNGPTSLPARTDGVCPYHADSLEECMELCSTAQPLCQSVAYDPDMVNGYGNCYPKSAFLASGVAKSDTAMLAFGKNLGTLSASCTNGTSSTASNKDVFEVGCANDLSGFDLAQVHAGNMSSCIDSCATYSNATTGDCAAVVFDSTLQRGWQNCYLKSKTGASYSKPGTNYAVKTKNTSGQSGGSGGSSGSGGGSSDGNTNHTSKAWIAGVVVGVIAALAIIGGAIWFFLRRRRANDEPASELAANAYVAGSGKSVWAKTEADSQGRHELDHQGNLPQELPAN